jgi:hypothetical protein
MNKNIYYGQLSNLPPKLHLRTCLHPLLALAPLFIQKQLKQKKITHATDTACRLIRAYN